MFVLNYSREKTLRLSNDAFFYLLAEEPPLDESNLEEAKEIAGMFPDGFFIKEGWRRIENSGLVEASFVPYEQSDIKTDTTLSLTKYIDLRIMYLSEDRIRVWWHDKRTNSIKLKGDYDVQINKYGRKYFQTGDYTVGKGCLYFL